MSTTRRGSNRFRSSPNIGAGQSFGSAATVTSAVAGTSFCRPISITASISRAVIISAS